MSDNDTDTDDDNVVDKFGEVSVSVLLYMLRLVDSNVAVCLLHISF